MKNPLDLTVMMYHYVRDPGDAADAGSGISGMPVSAFEAQLDELSQQYTFVTWVDVQAALLERRTLPGSACLLTFDDGVRDHYLNAFRVLHSRNLSGLFFILDRREEEGLVLGHRIHFLLAALGVEKLRDLIWKKLDSAERKRFTQSEKGYRIRYLTSSLDDRINLLKAVLQRDLSVEINPLLHELFEEYIGSEKETARTYYLNREQIQEMSAGGMHFGGHSRNHPWFDWIDVEARTTEIKASADWLRPIEPAPWAFAYPYGGLAEDSPQILKEYGFVAAFTTQAQIRHTDPFFIGRLDGEEIAQEGQRYV